MLGKWAGSEINRYKPSKRPWQWMGSRDIFRQYQKTNQPVRYAHCYTFALLLTTMCRALGIPARPVTIYHAGLDTDKNLYVDKYSVDNILIEDYSGDRIWDFHVWTEMFFERPDLLSEGEGSSLYDGWQVFDPMQKDECNDIVGPVPVYAIKEGHTNISNDALAAYAQVNGDISMNEWDKVSQSFVHDSKIKNM